MTALVSVAQQVGAPRVVRGVKIPHVLGNPDLPLERERALRREILKAALRALQTQVEEPTIFDVPSLVT